MTAGTVAVIGPGRVGSLLAVACSRAGRRVVVAGGSSASRDELRRRVPGIRVAGDAATAVADADLVAITTPDAAIGEVATALAAGDVLGPAHRVVHLAGSLGTGVLRRAALAGARVAACHPATTVPTGSYDPTVLVGVPWGVTAAPPDRAWAHGLVADLGGDPVDVPEDRRVLYHAALTVGSNAVGAATAVARALLSGAEVPDPGRFLGPLIAGSAGNVLRDGAVAVTGPVVRGDLGTLTAHLAALDADVPPLAAAYRHLGRAILEVARPALPPATADAIEACFEPPVA